MPIYDKTNEMSVYDLKKHPLYAFRPGSVVKRKPVEENKLGHVLDSCPQVNIFFMVVLMPTGLFTVFNASTVFCCI